MYMNLRHYQAHGSTAEASTRIAQGLVPLISRSPQFHAYYVMDAGAGRLVTVSLFAGRDEAEDERRLAAVWVAQHLATLVTAREDTHGDVTVRAGL